MRASTSPGCASASSAPARPAIQSIPVIAEQAEHVTVFQRTPNYSIPARNRPLSAEDRRWWKENYPELRRRAREEMRNGIVAEIPDKGALDDGAESARRALSRAAGRAAASPS